MKKRNILKFLIKNKSSKLYLLGFLLVGSIVSSSVSFAKYVEEYKENQQAGVADFNGYKVTFSSSPIPLPSTASNGIYAYVGYFKVEFESSEVRRAYSLSIKDVANNVAPNTFETTPSYDLSSFYLSSVPSTIYTSIVNSSNTSQVISSNVPSTITSNSITSFNANTIYLSSFIQKNESDVLTFNYSSISADTTLDHLTVCNDLIVEAGSNETHHYKFVYFVNVDADNVTPFNFIYKINLMQVQ